MQGLQVEGRVLPYRNESTQKPPRSVRVVQECSAASLLAAAQQNEAVVWRGDFHNAKQVLAAMKKKIRKPAKSDADPLTAFHKHRLAQSQQSRVLNMLLLEVSGDYVLRVSRSPDVRAVLRDVYGEGEGEDFLLPLNQLLGMIGAYEWHKKGVETVVGRVFVPFGVFSPLRGEYLDLSMQASLPVDCRVAWDIGTGSGVLAAILSQRGVPCVVGTDNNPRAVRCARENLMHLDGCEGVEIVACDGFPEGRADLIVCNPPWLPAKPTSAVETALYDENSAMLRWFLNGVKSRLNAHGEAWLIMSDLAEHLGLRTQGQLHHWIAQAGLGVVETLSVKPKHAKSMNPDDVLAFARMKETTFLFRLRPV